MDVAFTPQINEFRGIRTVQLNVADLRPNHRLREETEAERALYGRFVRQLALTPDEAARLLPCREEFVAVWRYLIANSGDHGIEEDFPCMGRKITRSAGVGPAEHLTLGKTRICLDVFAELGLIQLQTNCRYFKIRITTDGRKVDLNQSGIVQRLRAQKNQ